MARENRADEAPSCSTEADEPFPRPSLVVARLAATGMIFPHCSFTAGASEASYSLGFSSVLKEPGAPGVGARRRPAAIASSTLRRKRLRRMNDRSTIAADTKRRRKRVARKVNKYNVVGGLVEPLLDASEEELEGEVEVCVAVVADDSELDMVGDHEAGLLSAPFDSVSFSR